jgi:hypothetical protein
VKKIILIIVMSILLPVHAITYRQWNYIKAKSWSTTSIGNNSFPTYLITFGSLGNTNFFGVNVFYYDIGTSLGTLGDDLEGYAVGNNIFFFVPYGGGVSFIRARFNNKLNKALYTEIFTSNVTGSRTSSTFGTIERLYL